MMGTRSGSIDPGILLYMLRTRRAGWKKLQDALDHRSGLVGVSGRAAGMRELEYGTDLREIRPLLARWTGQVDPFCPLPKRRKLADYAQDAAVAADLALVWKRQVESMRRFFAA